MMGLTGKLGLFRRPGKNERDRVAQALEAVGMIDYLKRNIGRMSGGQQQRVFIARAIVGSPEVLILDEPTVGVDSHSEAQFYELIQKLNREMKLSMILVSHDLGVISSRMDTIACLNRRLHYHGNAVDFDRMKSEILHQSLHVLHQEILNYGFMRNALIAGIIIGFVAPLIGVFLVVRRMSLIADALSHITLSGVAAGLLASQYIPILKNISPIYFGMVFSIGGAFSIDKLRQIYRSYQELAIPIILSTGIGLGVVLISLANGFNVDLYGYLFGSLLSVTKTNLITIVIASLIIVTAIWVFYKELLYLSFDEESARISGLPRNVINLIFSVLVALVISVSMQVVGILLVSALITLPVAIALQLANSFRQTLLFAILFGQLSVISGLFIAYMFDLASGGTIVVVSVLYLLLVLLYKKIRNFFSYYKVQV